MLMKLNFFFRIHIANNDSVLPSSYVGKHSINILGETMASFPITSADTSYSPCSQDVFDRVYSNNFDWMSGVKRKSVQIHACISGSLIILSFLYMFFFSELTRRMRSLFKASYEPSGEIYGTNFSMVPGDIFPAYIPQVNVKGIAHPLIICDITGIDHRFVGWKDLDSDNFIEHNLFHDVPSDTINKETPQFSIVKHWKPPASDL